MSIATSLTTSHFVNDDPTEQMFCPFKTAQDLTTLGTLDTTRLFVGNLSYKASEDDLEQAMSTCLCGGRLRSCVVLRRQDGQSKGCGIIEFESISDARNAIISMQNSEIAGRPIFVREDREPAWRLDRLKKTRERRKRRLYDGPERTTLSPARFFSSPAGISSSPGEFSSSPEEFSSSPTSWLPERMSSSEWTASKELYWSAGWSM